MLPSTRVSLLRWILDTEVPLGSAFTSVGSYNIMQNVLVFIVCVLATNQRFLDHDLKEGLLTVLLHVMGQ